MLSLTLFSNIVLAQTSDTRQQFKELHQDITRGNIELTKRSTRVLLGTFRKSISG